MHFHRRCATYKARTTHPPLMRALFVCLHNAGRSQMSAALWTRAGYEARSAGTTPAEHVHPEVVEVMNELGIDLSRGRRRS